MPKSKDNNDERDGVPEEFKDNPNVVTSTEAVKREAEALKAHNDAIIAANGTAVTEFRGGSTAASAGTSATSGASATGGGTTTTT